MLFKVTPVSIPNTKVKLLEADGTAWETVWESKWLPGLYGSLAQSVEHMTFNHGVRSSTLRWITKNRQISDEICRFFFAKLFRNFEQVYE